MTTALTPYDTGSRAEPSTWTPSNSHLHSMPVDDRARILAHHGDDFGKVDFDNPEGQTIATVWATPTDDGWTLHIHQHAAPLALAADTSQLRELAGAALTAIEDAERSTEADTMDAVFEARDGAVDALRAILTALTPTTS
ncbi:MULTISPECIES: hypothetical protein [unclassified Microbacterium]|jgi:hypothetical protein|uniref:hypothetical protein n=1 Tax=unclassified Microbacterium TaxID=2609290 RepID=UPI003C2B1B36